MNEAAPQTDLSRARGPVAQSFVSAASYVPWATLGGFLALVIDARLRMGEWPRAMHWESGQAFPTAANIDPGQAGWLYGATWIGIGASAGIALLAVLMGGRLRSQASGAHLRFLMGASALLLVILINPFDLWNWYLD